MTKIEKFSLFMAWICIILIAASLLMVGSKSKSQTRKIAALQENSAKLIKSVQHLQEMKIAELKRQAAFRDELNSR